MGHTAEPLRHFFVKEFRQGRQGLGPAVVLHEPLTGERHQRVHVARRPEQLEINDP
jgi:hypothetical protein